MTTKLPYAPPASLDDIDGDEDFNDLPSDVELNFHESGRDDEDFEDSDSDWDFDRDDELFEDDDLDGAF